MLSIAVCVKQVPAYDDGSMDPETGLLQRAALESVINPYDLPAVETALRIKEKVGGRVDVFTMGPKKAKEAIVQTYSMGVDRGFLLNDVAFAGSDVLATSYTLAKAMNLKGPYDLIICGRQTTDGDTAQTGGAIATWLKIPHANWVSKLIDVNKKELQVTQLLEYEEVDVIISFPCAISVEKEIFHPRIPSLQLKLKAKRKEVEVIGLQDLADKDPNHYGLKGSATRVEKIFPAKKRKTSINYFHSDETIAQEEFYNLIAKYGEKTDG